MLKEKIINFIYKTALSGKATRAFFTPIAGGTFFTIIVLLIIGSLWLDTFLGLPHLVAKPLNLIVAFPFFTIGLFLMLWSVLYFLKAKGTPVPINPPPKVITDGPYSYSRNPMMTGLFTVLFGIGILFQSVCIVFIFIPFFIVTMVLELKYIEEPELEKRLGVDYLEYKKRVGMFMPLLKKGTPKNGNIQ